MRTLDELLDNPRPSKDGRLIDLLAVKIKASDITEYENTQAGIYKDEKEFLCTQ